ncbi:MAG TPA: hypothetical protein VH158_05860 [Gemmatimonadales bacterium]|jgi:hypothetical protein|nr:hypothetical protein [Gemmatimonadales bacterium]
MRGLSVVAIAGLVVGCQRPVEVRGLYVTDHQGTFLACDHPKTVRKNIVVVNDSALAARYRRTVTRPQQWLFVRLRGFVADSGSIYDSQRYFLVQQILEIRAPREGECPSNAVAVPSLLLLSPLERPRGPSLTDRRVS